MPAHMTITARLGSDPKLEETSSGKSVCNLTLPVNRGYGDKETTTWWTATLWGKSAEVAAQHLKKGRWVCVSGEAHVRTYEKKDGSTGFSAELNANSFSFVGNRADNEQAAAPSKGRGRYSIPENVNDGSIPF